MSWNFPTVNTTLSGIKAKAWLTMCAIEAVRNNGRINPDADESIEVVREIQKSFFKELKRGNAVDVESGMVLQFIYANNSPMKFVLCIYCDEDTTYQLGGCEADEVRLYQNGVLVAVLNDFSKSKVANSVTNKAAQALRESSTRVETRSQAAKKYFR